MRLRRSHYYAIIVFFACMPFLCALLAVQCWTLWTENESLWKNLERFEQDYQKAENRAERLENLEALLSEAATPGRDMILRRIAGEKREDGPVEEKAETAGGDHAEGPGHEDYPVLETDRVRPGNVQARAMRGNRLRIALDLRNSTDKLLSGEVSATLLTADGRSHPLPFEQRDAGAFRINHFKRAVMTAHVPADASLENSEVMLEVRDQDNTPIYRNIFAVEH